MPWKVVKDINACPVNKPWAVKNIQTGDVRGRCHASRESAIAQQRALYARVPEARMSEKHFISFADTLLVDKASGLYWLEALPARTFHTDSYGEVVVDQAKLERMVHNFRNNVRQQEVAIDYNHGRDVSKGDKASGWIRDVKIGDNGSLWYGVEFTDNAKNEIAAKEWRYFSAEWADDWLREDGETFQDVIVGGGLTNRPIAKGMVPINFSELYEETADLEFAVWTTAFMNNLPDSSFLYVEPGGKKDSGGKTVPRSKRHFPVKDSSGKVDLPHLRNAIARIPQSGISSSLKSSLQAKARSMLSRAGGKPSMAEEIVEAVDEHVAEEHAEPGTGSPPIPDYTLNPDDAAETGSRRVTPPPGNDENPYVSDEGEVTMTTDERLRELLGLDENADILQAVTELQHEAAPMKELAKTFSERKKFAEAYPEEAAELVQLRQDRIQSSAKQFSERFGGLRIKDAEGNATGKGLSSLAIEKLKETHMKFAEGSITMADFEGLMDSIFENGIVEYGERGSDRDNEFTANSADPRVAFSEAVQAEIAAEDGLEWNTAVRRAAAKHPDLAEQYQRSHLANSPTA